MSTEKDPDANAVYALGPGGRVVGIDANPEHVAMATALAAERGFSGADVLVADARHTEPGSTWCAACARKPA